LHHLTCCCLLRPDMCCIFCTNGFSRVPWVQRWWHDPYEWIAEEPIRPTKEGGSEWEPIKILLEGDRDSNKTNTASNTRLRLTTQVGQVHAATEVLLDLGTNKQPPEPKHTNTHSGNLHGLLPVLHRSDRWPAPVRPVTPVSRWAEPVKPVATTATQQAFQKASVTSLGPGTKTPQKHNLHGRKNLHKT
jgi:hypothetical protein